MTPKQALTNRNRALHDHVRHQSPVTERRLALAEDQVDAVASFTEVRRRREQEAAALRRRFASNLEAAHTKAIHEDEALTKVVGHAKARALEAAYREKQLRDELTALEEESKPD